MRVRVRGGDDGKGTSQRRFHMLIEMVSEDLSRTEIAGH